MGFQSGTKINPALGNADFSGFARAGEIRGQALANFGAQIGQGIEKYKKNKEITGVTLASIEATLGQNPDLIVSGKAEGGSTGKLFSKLEEGGSLNKREALELRGYLDTVVDTRAAAAKRDMDAATLANVQAKTNYYNARATGTTAGGSRISDPYSPKVLGEAQQYLNDNNLVAKDGMLYKQEAGFFGFGGKLVPVDNPALYTTAVEGVDFLVAQTMPGGAGPRPAASNNNITIEPLTEVLPTDSEITAGELASAAPEQLEGSRFDRVLPKIAGAVDMTGQVLDQMALNAMSVPGAALDFTFGQDSPEFGDSLTEGQRKIRAARLAQARANQPQMNGNFLPPQGSYSRMF